MQKKAYMRFVDIRKLTSLYFHDDHVIEGHVSLSQLRLQPLSPSVIALTSSDS